MPKSTSLNFTKRELLLLAAAPTGRRVTYHDTQVRGLQLIVTDKGAQTFYLRKKSNGQSKRLHLGRFPEVSVETARRAALAALGRRALGEELAQPPKPFHSALTLGDLFDQYRRRTAAFLRRPDKPEQTFRLYLSHWGNRPLASINHADVDALHKELAKRVSPTTANIALKLLHTLFNRAKSEWRIWSGDNPAHSVKKFAEASRDRFVLPKEMPYLLQAVQMDQNATIRDAILLALFTGARRANIQAMTWQQLDLGSALWHIQITKNGRPQLVHLCPEAVDLLRLRRQQCTSEYVFPGPGKTGHLREVKSGWSRVLTRAQGLCSLDAVTACGLVTREEAVLWIAKLEHCAQAAAGDLGDLAREAGVQLDGAAMSSIRFHDLRRTHASWMLRTGAAKHLVGKQLNHLSAQTTEVYARFLPGDEVPYVNDAVAGMLGTLGRRDDAKAEVPRRPAKNCGPTT